MQMKEIQYSDGALSKVATFSASDPTAVTFVCLPAMGVRASYYQLFANHLRMKGFNVITADWRGQGHSSVRASRTTDFGYERIVADVKELMVYADEWFPNTKKVIIGHSLGGQIGSLLAARYPELTTGLILVTSGSVYHKAWDQSTALKLRLAGVALYPISRVIGYFPGIKIGFGGKEARTVMKDWCYTALHGKYKLAYSTYDYEQSLQELSKPILSISVENDYLASKLAVENLYRKFNTTSAIEHVHLSSNETNIEPLTHFSWAKQPSYFANLVTNWTRQNV